MGSYWDGVKRRWKGMVDGNLPHDKPQSQPPQPPRHQFRMIRQKFRDFHGRDPYSDQELIDWWNRL